MELVQLNNVNQPNEICNGTFNQQQQQLIKSQQLQQQQVFQQQHTQNNKTHLAHQMQPQQQYLNQSQSHSQTQQQQQQQQNSRYPRMPRELPVDVPDSFVGVEKQSPRYPPPKPNSQYNNYATQSIPSPSNNTAGSPNNMLPNGKFLSPILSQTANHIMTHNSSLRDSIKLKQLEKPKNYPYNSNFPVGSMQPAINKAFEHDEDDIPNGQPQTNRHQQAPQQNNNKPPAARQTKLSISNFNELYSRLENSLSGEFTTISQDARLSKLLSIYSTIIQTHCEELKIPNLTSRHSPNATIYKVVDLIQSISTTLRNEEITLTKDAVELLDILSKHEIDGVATTFDCITQSFEFAKLSQPPTPQEPIMVTDNNSSNTQNINSYRQDQAQGLRNHQVGYEQVPMDIENSIMYHNNIHQQQRPDIELGDTMSIKTVPVEKANCQPLGATIRRDDTTGSIIIARLLYGGAAVESGLLHEGDEILEVNGTRMTNRSTDEVVNLLQEMNGTLNFTIGVRSYARPPPRVPHDTVFVKAFFDYHGSQDNFIPCKELCLNFEKGDILSIFDRSDPNWWQAIKYDDIDNSSTSLAYLIPSENFLRRKEQILNDTTNADSTNAYSKYGKKSPVSIIFNCGKNSSLRRRKKSMHMMLTPDQVPFYEELVTYYPTSIRKRPIILIGPNSIGRREILQLLLRDSDNFASAISHTSKPMKDRERNGIDFHFVSRAHFEADIKAGKFVEYGEFEKHYYGTSFDAIKTVVESKKTCVHLVNAPSILNFRQGRAGCDLKPFFVFVRPHNQIEKLQNIVSTIDQNSHADLQRIIDEAQAIEDNYLPFFDKVLTVTDIQQAYEELLQEINRIDTEPQWIPMIWASLSD